MASLNNEDDDMKALRAYSLKVEEFQSANKCFDPASDENDWLHRGIIKAIDRDDSEAWKRIHRLQQVDKRRFDLNGKADAAALAKLATSSQKRTKTETPTSQNLHVPNQIRFSTPRPNLTPKAALYRRITRHNEMVAATITRAAASKAGKKELEEASEAYRQACEANLMELEFGPSCKCNRYPWQHELHPSGTVTKREREKQQSEDAEMMERDGAGARLVES